MKGKYVAPIENKTWVLIHVLPKKRVFETIAYVERKIIKQKRCAEKEQARIEMIDGFKECAHVQEAKHSKKGGC